MIKLSEWASKHGINYQTAYRWYKAGKLPAKNIVKTPTGTILVEEIDPENYSSDSDDAIMNDETLPLSKRLVAAYRFINSNKPPSDIPAPNIPYPEKLASGKQLPPSQKTNSILDLDEEYQQLKQLKDTYIKTGNVEKVNEIIILMKNRSKDLWIEQLPTTILSIQEDIKLMTSDVKELMSNVFGDDRTLMDRIRSRYLHDIKQALDDIFKNAKSFEDLQKNYENYTFKLLSSTDLHPN